MGIVYSTASGYRVNTIAQRRRESNMVITVIYGIVFVTIIWLLLFRQKSPNLDHIPGPKQSAWTRIFGSPTGTRTDPRKRHMLYEDMKREYGPIFRVTDGVRTYVVISDYASIYQVSVTQGKQFGGRLANYKIKEVLKSTGILFSHEASNTWRTLRKISHKHLRQFGDGLSRLENVIGEVADDMFDEFKHNEGLPFDPEQTIFDAALNTIVYLITGERTHAGDALVEDMRAYESLFIKTVPVFAPLSFKLLNRFHVLKYLGFDNWEPYQRFVRLHHDMWEKVKEMNEANPESESICKVLSEHIAKADGSVDEDDARSTAATLLLAGVTTTSSTFHGVVNILAHHPEVQCKIYQEVKNVVGSGGSPTLSDRPKMPYARAVLHEVLRYTSVVANGVQHRALQDGILHGYKIPAGTPLEMSIWNLHHDEEFWEDPYEFRPERFLDESGDVIPADHPNRKHLMPFGAGTRVCLGESLAIARLFIWITTLVSRFEVEPAPGNLKTSADARMFSYQGVLKPIKYQVVFKGRK